MASVKITFDSTGLNEKLRALGDKLEKATRPAAFTASDIFYKEVLIRAPVSEKAHSTRGKQQTYQPGNLKRAVYQVFSADASTPTKSTYEISFNKTKAFYGRFVEFGTVNSPAYPFIRPAYDAQKSRAAQAAKDKFLELASEAINGI